MTPTQKRVLAVLVIAGLIYFLIFLGPNMTGAKDPAMLTIFEPDESAQYQHPMRMLEPGISPRNSVRKFINYQHYFYGFPFYLSSILFGLLPLKLLVGIGSTTWNLLVLRQMISIVPMIMVAMVLVYTQTRYKSYLSSLFLFIFLLTIPAVFKNSTWWHPDSLLILFISLTFFFLDRDRLRFGRNFTFAAIACGLATGTKLIGLFFFLAVPIYILVGLLEKRLTVWGAVRKAVLFVLVMFATFVLVNPFLFNESQRIRALKIQINQAEAMRAGWNVLYSKGPAAWYPMIKEMYGSLIFIALMFLILALNIWKGYRRLLNILIAAFVIPFLLYVLLTIVIKPTHFLLPAALPLFSLVVAAFAVIHFPKISTKPTRLQKSQIPYLVWAIVIILIVSVQMYRNLEWDMGHYQHVLNREKESQEIQFYNELEAGYLSKLPQDQHLDVFRDVRIYFPSDSPWPVHVKSRPINYAFVDAEQIDLILMWNQRILDYTQEGILDIAIDRQEMELVHQFYSDLKSKKPSGYELLYATECCSAYLREELYREHFP